MMNSGTANFTTGITTLWKYVLVTNNLILKLMYCITRISEHKFNLSTTFDGELLLKDNVSLLQAIMILNYLNGGSPNSTEFAEFLGTLS